MKNLFSIFCAFCATVMLLSSCNNEPKGMTDAEKQAIIDSTYEAQATLVREEMISKCTNEMEMRVQPKVDSIVAAKMSNMEGENAGMDNMANNSESAMANNDMEKAESTKMDNEHGDDMDNGEKKDEMTDEEYISMKVEEKIAELRKEMEMECQQRVMDMANHNADSIIQMQMEASTATPGGKKTTPAPTTTTNPKSDKMSGEKNTDEKKDKMSGEKNTDAKKKKMGGGGN